MAAKLSGGAKKRFDLGQNSEINVTPFVDVMLVLLIIFMVAAPLATTALKIDLPPAQAPKDPTDKKPTFLSIRKGGEVYVISQDSTQKVQDLAHLTATLAPLLTGEGALKDRTVLIRADRDVRLRAHRSRAIRWLRKARPRVAGRVPGPCVCATNISTRSGRGFAIADTTPTWRTRPLRRAARTGTSRCRRA